MDPSKGSPTTPPPRPVHVEHDPIFFQNRHWLSQLIALGTDLHRRDERVKLFSS